MTKQRLHEILVEWAERKAAFSQTVAAMIISSDLRKQTICIRGVLTWLLIPVLMASGRKGLRNIIHEIRNTLDHVEHMIDYKK